MWVDAPQVGNFNDQKWGISVIAVTGHAQLSQLPAMRVRTASRSAHEQRHAQRRLPKAAHPCVRCLDQEDDNHPDP